MILMSLFIISCQSSNENIEAYAVVHYESNLMGGTTGKVIFGQQYNIKGKQSTVYHINEKKQVMQIQPTRSDNYLFNNNAPWDDLGKFELIGTDTVYYFGDDFISGYQKFMIMEVL